MFPLEILAAYVLACILVVLSPGPDNILAISRGLSQGRLAALLTSAGAGCGIMSIRWRRPSAWRSCCRLRLTPSGSSREWERPI